VLTHGAGNDRRAMQRYAPLLHELDIHVLLYDSRYVLFDLIASHVPQTRTDLPSDMGLSDQLNRGIGLGAREMHDVKAAVDFIARRTNSSRIILFGTSQGISHTYKCY